MLKPVFTYISSKENGDVRLTIGALQNYRTDASIKGMNRETANELNRTMNTGLVSSINTYESSFYHGKYYYITNGYSLMKEVRKGDFLIHNSGGKLSAISVVKEDCKSGGQPRELKDGQNEYDWDDDGWVIYTQYYVCFVNKISSKSERKFPTFGMGIPHFQKVTWRY